MNSGYINPFTDFGFKKIFGEEANKESLRHFLNHLLPLDSPKGTCVYSHLAAANELGYQLMAAYALHWQALDYFAERVECIHLGAGAGLAEDPQDGLTRFKKGWATDSRMAYLCGHIFDLECYQQLAIERQGSFFPIYR